MNLHLKNLFGEPVVRPARQVDPRALRVAMDVSNEKPWMVHAQEGSATRRMVAVIVEARSAERANSALATCARSVGGPL
jgi:hypothetical protein